MSAVVMAESNIVQGGPSSYHEAVRRLLRASASDETRRVYRSCVRTFASWCIANGFVSFPAAPDTVASYIAAMGERPAPVATVMQMLAALTALHKAGGCPSPVKSQLVQKTLKGYKRKYGVPQKKVAAATADVIRILLDSLYAAGDTPMQIRDRAVIALGFAGAFRRSELAALDVSDLEWTVRKGREICLITVRRSKTDQDGRGMTKAIFPSDDAAYSPTGLLKRWTECAGITEGPLFRAIVRGGHIQARRMTAQTVRDIMIRTGEIAGLNLNLSAHSLRSGFVTTTIRQGKSERAIMNQTGHRSVQVLREYFQRESAIEDNAADGVM